MNNQRRYSPVPPSQSVSIHNNYTTHRIYTFISVASLLITALIAAIRITNRYEIDIDDPGLIQPSNNSKYYGSTTTDTKIVIPVKNKTDVHNPQHTFTPLTTTEESIIPTKVAFIGNSILYYNDSPRFLSKLVSVSSTQTFLQQDSCLRGGASLVSITSSGNGMEEKFHTLNAKRPDGSYDIGSPTIQSLLQNTWDYVIMNDYTQQPARIPTRQETIQTLKETYIPLFNQEKLIVPVLLMTHAYRKPIKNSDDLYPFGNFTRLLCEGYQEYARAIDESLHSFLPDNHDKNKSITRIAYVGKAFEILHNENRPLWEKLYYMDDLHPSTYGTLLQGFVLYCTIYYPDSTKECNPPIFEYDSDVRTLWNDSRRMYPPEDNVVVHYPSVEDVGVLRKVAIRVWRMSVGDRSAIC